MQPLLRRRDFVLYLVLNLARTAATQIVAVGVGWQVYAIHRDPFDLGLVGLAEFVPLPLLALPAGQLSDRASRRLLVAVSTVFLIAGSAGLLAVTVTGARALWPYLVLALLTGAANALGMPASRALPPELVPPADLAAAFALRSTTTQLGAVSGPAVGGLLFSVRPSLVYVTALVLLGLALAATLALHRRGGWVPANEEPPGLAHLFGGILFLRRSRVVFGAILLDLFAVLFGGAVALLPVFARSILHTGPTGLGVLRSAPAVGGIVAGFPLARRPRGQRLRRHGERQHPLDDGRDGDARRAPRPRELRRDGVHQRLEPARRVRVGDRRGADRNGAGGRRRRRGDGPRRRAVAAVVPVACATRPAQRAAAGGGVGEGAPQRGGAPSPVQQIVPTTVPVPGWPGSGA